DVDEKTLLSSKHIAATRSPRNSEAACLRLGVALSESAAVTEMGAEALSFYSGDEPKVFGMGFGTLADWFTSTDGTAFLAAAAALNKSNGLPDQESDVEAAVRGWLLGLEKLTALEKQVRRVAQVSARTYLWAMDTLEQLATTNFPKKAFAQVDEANALRKIKAIASMLRKPSDSKSLRKAMVAAYMKQIFQSGRKKAAARPLDADTSPEERGSSETSASAAASSSSAPRNKAGKKRTRRTKQKGAAGRPSKKTSATKSKKQKKEKAASSESSPSKAPKTLRPAALTCSSNEEATSSQPDDATLLQAWALDKQTLFAESLANAWSSKDKPKASGQRLSLPMLLTVLENIPGNILEAYGLQEVREALKDMSRLPNHAKLEEIFERLQALRDKLHLPDVGANEFAAEAVATASTAVAEPGHTELERVDG
ncbi:unnamed protein product, partial [Symbiodinium sp. CCMP2456]